MDRLPLYRLTIDLEAEGMDYMGLVDTPAHGKGWQAFSKIRKAKAKAKRQYFNDEKRIVTGVAIATNLQIYRRTEDGFEYNVYFTKEDTKEIAIKLAENGYMNNVNEMHDMNKEVSDMVLFESYFIEDDKRNIPDAFEDQNLQPGTWITSYKVNNDEVWEKIKDGEFYGFSIEGWFKEVEVNIKKEEMKKAFVVIKGKYATIQEVTKWDMEVVEDDIKVGTELHWKWIDMDGNVETGGRINDGEYQWDGHTIQVDSNGVVVMIDGKVEEVTLRKKSKKRKMKKEKLTLFEKVFGKKTKTKNPDKVKFDKDKHGEATTVDGVVVSWEGDEPVEGESLFIKAEDDELILADEGEYSIDRDGSLWVITVDTAGLITSIEEVEEEEMEEAMLAMKADYEKKIASQKKDYEKKLSDQDKSFNTKLEVLVKDSEELREEFEKLADPEGAPGKKKHSSDNTPGWKNRKGK